MGKQAGWPLEAPSSGSRVLIIGPHPHPLTSEKVLKWVLQTGFFRTISTSSYCGFLYSGGWWAKIYISHISGCGLFSANQIPLQKTKIQNWNKSAGNETWVSFFCWCRLKWKWLDLELAAVIMTSCFIRLPDYGQGNSSSTLWPKSVFSEWSD